MLSRVGEGTYGVVLRCVHKATGTFVAIKQFKDSNDQERVSSLKVAHMLRSEVLSPVFAARVHAEQSWLVQLDHVIAVLFR